MDTTLQKGIYEHYKGKLYRVIELARHSETEELFVVYQQLYGEHAFWIRPYPMFIEQVTVNGQSRPRFRYVGENMGD